MALDMYIDGSCHPNPGRGGWAWVLYRGNKQIRKKTGAILDSTSNRMELQAAIQGVKYIHANYKFTRVNIWSDSKYVVNGITKWIFGWKKKDWKNRDGDPVKNKDLWEILEALVGKCNIKWTWVKGHNKSKKNKHVDALAYKAATGRKPTRT